MVDVVASKRRLRRSALDNAHSTTRVIKPVSRVGRKYAVVKRCSPGWEADSEKSTFKLPLELVIRNGGERLITYAAGTVLAMWQIILDGVVQEQRRQRQPEQAVLMIARTIRGEGGMQMKIRLLLSHPLFLLTV